MSQLAGILTKTYRLDGEALAAAERVRAEKGGSLGDILVQQKAITEAQLLDALGAQFGVPHWPKLPLNDIDAELVTKVPIQFLRKHSMVPLGRGERIAVEPIGLGQDAGQL
jgi:general secretion pathway protein E